MVILARPVSTGWKQSLPWQGGGDHVFVVEQLLNKAQCGSSGSMAGAPRRRLVKRRMMTLTLTVNGEARAVEAAEDTPLLAVLRNELGLLATRFGCGHEQCGACMVLLDGQPAYSCTLPVSSVGARTV